MSSSEFRHYTRDEFLAEFYPDPADKAAIAAGMEQLRAEQRYDDYLKQGKTR